MKTAASTKQSWAEDVRGSPCAITGCLRACYPTGKEHSWALKTLGSLWTFHKDLCNQPHLLPSGLKLCVERTTLSSLLQLIFKLQTS